MSDRVKQLAKQYGGVNLSTGIAPLTGVNELRGTRKVWDQNTQSTLLVDRYNNVQQFKAPQQTDGRGFLSKIGGQTVDLGAAAFRNTSHFVLNTPKYIYQGSEPLLRGVAETVTGASFHALKDISKQRDQLDKISENYKEMYRTGKMSKDQFASAMRSVADSYQNLSTQAQEVETNAKLYNPARVAESAANTAAVILSGGRLKINVSEARVAGEGFVILKQSPEATRLGAVVTRFEDAVQRIPAVRDLVKRNATKFMANDIKMLQGQSTFSFAMQNAKEMAFGMLLKRPIVYETNIGLAKDTLKDLHEGDYPQAVVGGAWMASQMVSGGPLGLVWRGGAKTGKYLKQVAVGSSVVDEFSRVSGHNLSESLINGDNFVKDAINKVKTNPAAAQKEFSSEFITELETIIGSPIAKQIETGSISVVDAMKKVVAVNLEKANGDVKKAVDYMYTHILRQVGGDVSRITPEMVILSNVRWAYADELTGKVAKALNMETNQIVAVRMDTATKKLLADFIETLDTNNKDEWIQQITKFMSQNDMAVRENVLFAERLKTLIIKSNNTNELAKSIRGLSTAALVPGGVPRELAKEAAKLGYTFAIPKTGRDTPYILMKDAPKLVSAVSKGASDIYDPGMAPVPFMADLRSFLNKTGLSPESNTKVAYEALKNSIVTNLEQSGYASSAGLVGDRPTDGVGYIFSRLQDYINKQKPNKLLNLATAGRNQQSALQDVRQMSISEIQEALPGFDKAMAKGVRKAIDKAYLDVPMEFRGLGVKAWDYMYALPGARYMYRAMGGLRYSYNPFFRSQEIVETKILTKLKSNNLTWMKAGEHPITTRARLDDAVQQIRDAKVFTSGYTGESTQDLTLGRLHANLLKTQERDLAGLALAIADKRGVSLQTLLTEHADDVSEALRVIVQYPSKGVLNSALARTLNIAFFPMRYNIKVAGLFASELAKQPPTVQLAVINSTFKASDWLKSPEGIRWQSEHSEAIKLFQYFTPYGNVATVYSLLKNGKVNSAADIGLIGGLPFGFITQILDSEGLIHLNTPYVQPETGNVLPDWVPQTTKAKAATALEAFIGTLFTYPGRIIGMPGKSKLIRDQVNLALQTDYKDYAINARLDDLTPLQKKWVEVLQNPDTFTQDDLDQMLMMPAPGEFPWYTLPSPALPQPIPELTNQEVRALKASKSSSKSSKAKKTARPIEKR